MRLKVWHFAIGVPVFLLVVALVTTEVHASQDAVALQYQLRLAKAEGLVTSVAEFEATIPPAKPEDNAASYYKKLQGLEGSWMGHGADPTQLNNDFLFHPSPQSKALVEKYLDLHADALGFVDAAVKKPKCWFDRDWSQGAATLMPEYVDMKWAAKLLVIRESIEATDGRTEAALADARNVQTIARHADEEGHEISALVSEAIYSVEAHELAALVFLHRDEPAYRSGLAALLNAEPPPDLKREHRDYLLSAFSLIDLTSTAQGRIKLGLEERDDVSVAWKAMATLMSQPKAKVAIVKGAREYWAALDLPEDRRTEAIKLADLHVNEGMLAFPLAAKLRDELSFDQTDAKRDQSWKAQKLEYEAFMRATSARRIPGSINTSDLLSPFDGKPVDYHFDGKQIGVTVSGFVSRPLGGSTPIALKVPPDKELRP